MNHLIHNKKDTPQQLTYKVCLDKDPCPHYFDSYQKAMRWLQDQGKGQIKKRSVVEFAFPLEKKIAREVWIGM